MAELITRLNLHYPRAGGLSNAQIAALAEDWTEDLEGYSMPVIREAMKLCRTDKDRHYFPSVGEFMAYCNVAQGELERWTDRTCIETTVEKPEISEQTRKLIEQTKRKLAARMTA